MGNDYKYRFLLIVYSVLFASYSLVSAKDYDLYYLGGQSNMDGYGKNNELPGMLNTIQKGVYIFHGNTAKDMTDDGGEGIWAELRPGHGRGFKFENGKNVYSERFGVEISFAKYIKEKNPEANIAIIKYSKGGTSIAINASRKFGCWHPDFNVGNGINQYDHFLATVRNALSVDDIDGDGEKDRLIPKGIIWMQGESDAGHTKATALQYKKNLKQLMDLIRAAFRVDDLPVVVGRISDSGRDSVPVWDYGQIVREQQEEYVKDDANAALVNTTDNYGYSDKYHYDSQGYIDLGRQFAKAVLKLNK